VVDELKLTSHLAILEGKSVLYLLNMEPSQLRYMYGAVGQRMPLYYTALGKSLTAWRTPEEIASLLENCTFAPKTEHTIRSFDEFMAELETVRKLGYSVDREESVLGMRCVAAPVRDQQGNVVAAISVSGYGEDVDLSK